MRNCVTIFVPIGGQFRMCENLREALDNLTMIVGGCTIVEARGKWATASGVQADRLDLHSWWFDEHGFCWNEIQDAVRAVIGWLHLLGEDAVAVETSIWTSDFPTGAYHRDTRIEFITATDPAYTLGTSPPE